MSNESIVGSALDQAAKRCKWWEEVSRHYRAKRLHWLISRKTYADTLTKIAKKYLGDAELFEAVFVANRDVIDDPEEIQPGMVLKIPNTQNPNDE